MYVFLESQIFESQVSERQKGMLVTKKEQPNKFDILWSVRQIASSATYKCSKHMFEKLAGLQYLIRKYVFRKLGVRKKTFSQ
jgi:hypothetical protein